MTVTLLDSSAWIEFLRDTGSDSCERVDSLLAADAPIATTDVVLMELLAGIRSERDRTRVWSLLNRARFYPVRPLFDYEQAAMVYRTCRSGGVTPGQLTDCLIAAIAIREDAVLLHADADFDRMAEHVPLRVA